MASSNKTSGPLNIIFCHVDQLRRDAISALGNPHVSTPNIDAIMRAGTSFLRAQASHPVSAPSRTSWYTGRMPSEHGTFSNDRKCEKTITDIGQWMGARGYDCYHVGKWHMTGRREEPSFKVLLPHYGVGEHKDDVNASVVENFLAQRKGDKPFLLNIGLLNPHDCCYMTGLRKNPCMKFGLEDELEDECPPLRTGFDPSKPIDREDPEMWTASRMRLNNYIYYRMVEAVDEAVGRIFRALGESRFAENTVFIFSSDHGEMLGEHNWLGKNVLYEGSLRVPLTIVAPGRIPADTRNDTTLTLGVDVTATILDYAGLKPMPDMSIARSLRPVLEGKTKVIHDYLPAETSMGGPFVSIRRGDYKSITQIATGEMQLYNTVADPDEKKNLAGSEPALAAEHRALIADYQKRLTYCENYRVFLKDPKAGKGKKGDKDDD